MPYGSATLGVAAALLSIEISAAEQAAAKHTPPHFIKPELSVPVEPVHRDAIPSTAVGMANAISGAAVHNLMWAEPPPPVAPLPLLTYAPAVRETHFPAGAAAAGGGRPAMAPPTPVPRPPPLGAASEKKTKIKKLKPRPVPQIGVSPRFDFVIPPPPPTEAVAAAALPPRNTPIPLVSPVAPAKRTTTAKPRIEI